MIKRFCIGQRVLVKDGFDGTEMGRTLAFTNAMRKFGGRYATIVDVRTTDKFYCDGTSVQAYKIDIDDCNFLWNDKCLIDSCEYLEKWCTDEIGFKAKKEDKVYVLHVKGAEPRAYKSKETANTVYDYVKTFADNVFLEEIILVD